ncbi:MAG: hypothetical protein PHH54_06935 [Candidatus Nanoarchaeia archaeon]|nr:hypothetical protein [Candidatus Nanoarchaeia archaeon]MDD5741690.1 hypothetical protein [Candidatus Nanoarchaeia archaeon]
MEKSNLLKLLEIIAEGATNQRRLNKKLSVSGGEVSRGRYFPRQNHRDREYKIYRNLNRRGYK